MGDLLPFQRPFLPLVDESYRQHGEEDDHRPEAESPDPAEGNRPGEQEGDLEVEDDEQDRNEIETDVEAPASVVECLEPALIGRQLLRIGLLAGEKERAD